MQNIAEQLKKELEGFSVARDAESVGRVTKIADGVAEIEGLPNAMMSEMLVFDVTDEKSIDELMAEKSAPVGMVLNLESGAVKAVVLSGADKIREEIGRASCRERV